MERMIDMTEGEAKYLKYRFKQYLGSVGRAIQNKRLEEQKMGRLIDADKLSFYGFFDAGDYSIVRQTIYNAPTVEAIPKADYENRLKVDMVAMLTDIQSEIKEKDADLRYCGHNLMAVDCIDIIQQKIDALNAGSEL